MEIEWEDPPQGRGSSNPMTQFLAELRKHPGKWAKYPHTYKSSGNISGYRIKNPDIEFRAKKVGPDQTAVWGRCKEVTDDQA